MTKKILLAGVAATTLMLLTPTSAEAQTCIGRQIRPNVCLDHQGNVISDVNKHWLCDEFGARPRTTLDGCGYHCPSPPPPPSSGDNNNGDGDGDPLVFDLDGNGVSLVNVDECTMFDIDNDGEVNQTGWVDSNDGLLVFDDNGNGIVDDQSELFGNNNNAAYAHLANHDDNDDGVIDRRDSIWNSLQLWVDANSNGQTDAGELKSIRSVGFEEISVNYTTVEQVREGNRVTQTGTFTRWVRDEYQNFKRVVGEVVEVFFDFF